MDEVKPRSEVLWESDQADLRDVLGGTSVADAAVPDELDVDTAELARMLRATARAAATRALREGLVEIDREHGQNVADQVARLIDVADVFAGVLDEQDSGGDDEPFKFKPDRGW